MPSFLLLSFLLLVPAYSFSQNTVKGTVIDDKTSASLVYATISVVGQKGGVYTNGDGQFKINAELGDSLLITMLGYEPLRVVAQSDESSYRLRSVSYTTELVVVTDGKKKARREKLGDFRSSNYSYSGWWKAIVVQRLGATNTENGWLTKVFYRLNVHGSQCSVYARVRLFSNNEEQPGEALLSKNILIKLKGAKTKYEVDIQEEKIAFPPGGLFVGIEFLTPDSDCENVEDRKRRFYVKMAETDHLKSWVRPSPGSSWRKFGDWDNGSFNACIGAEVIY